jgi:hypothetical protein
MKKRKLGRSIEVDYHRSLFAWESVTIPSPMWRSGTKSHALRFNVPVIPVTSGGVVDCE